MRLWLYEVERVYRDKFIDEKDMEIFDKFVKDIVKKFFEVILIFCNYRYVKNIVFKGIEIW